MSGLAVLCPGQGDQHPGMLDLPLRHAGAAEVVRRAGAALGEDLAALARGGGAAIFANAAAQPLLCVAELATWTALAPLLPRPTAFAGYSVGELAAYACAGALGPEDVALLARRRAALMDAAAPAGAGLLAVRGVPVAALEALAAGSGAALAIVNGPDHCVVGGATAALDAAAARASAAGAVRVARLPVAVPAHTPLLAGAVPAFAAELERSGLRDPEAPVLAGVSGAPVRTRAAAVAALSTQLARPLAWDRCLEAAAELGCTVFLELGPGTALARMAAEALPDVAARSVCDFRTAEGVARWVGSALRR